MQESEHGRKIQFENTEEESVIAPSRVLRFKNYILSPGSIVHSFQMFMGGCDYFTLSGIGPIVSPSSGLLGPPEPPRTSGWAWSDGVTAGGAAEVVPQKKSVKDPAVARSHWLTRQAGNFPATSAAALGSGQCL